MPLNREYVEELLGVHTVTPPQDYIIPPLVTERKSRLNREYVESLLADETQEVQDNKAAMAQPATLTEPLTWGPAEQKPKLTYLDMPRTVETEIKKKPYLPLAQQEFTPFDPAEPPIKGETFKAGAVERGAIAAARATGILKILPVKEAGLAGGAAVPSPDELKTMSWYKKIPEAVGWTAEQIGELAAMHGILKGLGVIGRMPKHPTIWNKAAEMARWFGGAEGIRQGGKLIGETITQKPLGYKPQEIIKSAALGYLFSLGLSGTGAIARKLFTPAEKKLALRVLGLKKGATEEQVKVAVGDLGKRVRAGEVSKKDHKLITQLYNRWLAKKPDIIYAKARAKPPAKRLITEAVTPPSEAAAAAPVAKVPAEAVKPPPKPTGAITEGKEAVALGPQEGSPERQSILRSNLLFTLKKSPFHADLMSAADVAGTTQEYIKPAIDEMIRSNEIFIEKGEYKITEKGREALAKPAQKGETEYGRQKKEGLVRGEPQREEPGRPVQVEKEGEGEIGPSRVFQGKRIEIKLPKGVKIGDTFEGAGQTWKITGLRKVTGGNVGIAAETAKGKRVVFAPDFIKQKLAKPTGEIKIGDIIRDDLVRGRVLGEGIVGKNIPAYKIEILSGHEKGTISVIAKDEARLEKTKPTKKGGRPLKELGGAAGVVGDIGEVGVTGIDTGRIKVSIEPGAKPQSAGEIIDYMSRAFGIVIRGKATHHKKALGWFDPKAIGVRMKDVRSITTGTHEVAHHIDWSLNNRMSLNPPTTAIRDELLALGKALYGKKKPKGGYKSEGWAEFIREYLTGEEAKEKAPNLYKWFTETYLPGHKDMAKKIAKTRDMIIKWRLQGAEARVDSQINKKQLKGPFSEWFKRGLLWVETSFRDEFAPIKRAMIRAGIREGELIPAEDPYQIAVARADKAGAIARQFVLEYTTDTANNRTGKGLREILKPVAKDINNFIRWIITARARFLHKKGINPGISKADADYVYEKYDNELWQNTLKELTHWNHRVLDYLGEAGGIDSAAIKLIKESNPIYIPFMRAFKEGELRIAGGYGKGIAKVTKPIKKIKGSGREIIDPIESMIKQTQKIIAVAHKAEIAKALVHLATKKGTGSMIWKVPAPKQAMRFEAEQLKKHIAKIAYERMGLDPAEISSGMAEHWDDLLTVYSNAGQYYGKDNIVGLVIDGKRQWYEVDPALYRAIDGIDQYSLPWFLAITFGKATRMVRLGATGLNPAFGLIRNFLRDAMTFTVLSKHAKAGPISAVKGIAEDIINTQAAMKFKAMGGKMSSQILADRRAVQHLKKHVLANTIAGKMIFTVAHPIDGLRELFGVTEAGTRIGEYTAALKYAEKKWGKGSKSAAIYALNQAQDVTTNFSRHGKIAKVLNQMIPFFNAAIQGPDKIIRTFGKRPVVTSLKAIIALTIPAIWLWWRYKDDEWYQNIPIYERVNYLHFKIPGRDIIIRIPVPFELGHIFQSAPVAALDAYYRKDAKIVNEMFEESLKQANPFDWPAIFAPIIDIMANEDFAGRPIVPKSVEYKLPQDQYGNYTTELMKIIGKAIGYSPAKLEHLLTSYSGGLYTRIARTIDLKNKEEITLTDMPILGTLFLREPYAPRAQLNRFYQKRDLLNQKYSSGKITGKEKSLRKKYNSISRKLSAQWQKLPDTKTQKDKIRIYQKMKRQLNKVQGIN